MIMHTILMPHGLTVWSDPGFIPGSVYLSGFMLYF